MGTFTAQILVGHSHLYHGEIKPSHVLFLSENGRSAWCLYSLLKNKSQTVDSSTFRIWLCDPDTLLEDAMLMIALFVKKDKNFIKFVEKVNKKLLSEKYLEFTTFLSIREKQLFYRKVQSIGTD